MATFRLIGEFNNGATSFTASDYITTGTLTPDNNSIELNQGNILVYNPLFKPNYQFVKWKTSSNRESTKETWELEWWSSDLTITCIGEEIPEEPVYTAFQWKSEISANQKYKANSSYGLAPITAQEWTDLQNNINELKGNYTWTYKAIQGQPFTANHYNEVADKLGLARVSSGQTIMAEHLLKITRYLESQE